MSEPASPPPDHPSECPCWMCVMLRAGATFEEVQAEFHARGKRSKERLEATGVSYTTEEVMDRMRAKIEQRRREILGADARRELGEGRAVRFDSVDDLLDDLKRED